MENQLPGCGCHHLRGIHGGYIRLTKTPDGKLEWVIAGRVWEGARKWREQEGLDKEPDQEPDGDEDPEE
jgi:hypothetical protein